ncbi:hypothetical protein NEOLI_000516 [Neolecta irregularis DAH-3]|uniref:Uncharacterized protein n=1 Tax=Neolecta irregularis (strain DAH-3) TaxID=1198029 RepID=A0A1U7LRW6_NEOID|nr:hypothetical protein NEOLI_000516 [Neolecta irregularis DAH-3]|eukprot:OLL25420.1 hypothetical protein NEOLI_000516 [Neolecta irregularis DAH-3]
MNAIPSIFTLNKILEAEANQLRKRCREFRRPFGKIPPATWPPGQREQYSEILWHHAIRYIKIFKLVHVNRINSETIRLCAANATDLRHIRALWELLKIPYIRGQFTPTVQSSLVSASTEVGFRIYRINPQNKLIGSTLPLSAVNHILTAFPAKKVHRDVLASSITGCIKFRNTIGAIQLLEQLFEQGLKLTNAEIRRILKLLPKNGIDGEIFEGAVIGNKRSYIRYQQMAFMEKFLYPQIDKSDKRTLIEFLRAAGRGNNSNLIAMVQRNSPEQVLSSPPVLEALIQAYAYTKSPELAWNLLDKKGSSIKSVTASTISSLLASRQRHDLPKNVAKLVHHFIKSGSQFSSLTLEKIINSAILRRYKESYRYLKPIKIGYSTDSRFVVKALVSFAKESIDDIEHGRDITKSVEWVENLD